MLAVAFGIGAAVAGGTAVANAEGPGADGSGASAAKSPSSNSGAGSNGAAVHTPTGSSTPPTKVAASGGPTSHELGGLAKRVAAALTPGAPAAPGRRSPTEASARTKPMIRVGAGTTIHGSTTQSAPPDKPDPAPTPKPEPVATLVANTRAVPATVVKPAPQPAAPPISLVLGALQSVQREIERASLNLTSRAAPVAPVQPAAQPAAAAAAPSPTDDAPTAYGDIGKWMLQSNGQISNYGGQPYGGKTLLEPVNVIIVDPHSSSPQESAARLNNAMYRSGFPAQPIHSTGFRGTIDDVTYSQQPTGPLLGYSNNSFLLPNDHGRIFGPDPMQTSTGYVWSGAFSTEQLGLYGLLLTHTYVSSNAARNALAMRLVSSGQATYGGVVPLNNAYNTDTTTTGDHDGYAVVLVLR